MGKMDISERRLPQDGRSGCARVKGEKKDIDFRISTMPTVFGEKIVMRILDRDQVRIDLTQLGLEPEPLDWFREAIHQPYGMCLVVGPVRLRQDEHALLGAVGREHADVNIITCEDPVEFSPTGLNQVQATESSACRSRRRCARSCVRIPNIIFVGEIRDFETAEIAVKAALTGHLVLSTLHTNDAPACINRLTNMGVEPFLIGTSLHLVVAQRLVRRICDLQRARSHRRSSSSCRWASRPTRRGSIEPFKGTGCPACEGIGYKGRTGLFEVLRLTNEMRELILYNGSPTEIKQLALRQGMRTLRKAGLQKVREGLTSCEEVVRETIG